MITRRQIVSFTLTMVAGLLWVLPLLAGCNRSPSTGGQGSSAGSGATDRPGGVVVTIFPLYDLVRQVAGPEIEVSLLLPPELSPHTYQMTPADVRLVAQAKLLVANGGGLDSWVDDLASKEAPRGLRMLSFCPESDDATEHEDEHDDHGHDHDHGPTNPHQWLVPEEAAHFVSEIAAELRDLFPIHSEKIRSREMNLIGDLAALIVEYEDTIAPLTDRRMITFHDSFNPLAEAFGLEVVATLYTFESMDVTPAAIQEAARQIRELNVRAVFIEPQINPAAAERLGELVELRTLDPLGSPDRPGVRSYQEMMRTNLKALVEGLEANAGDGDSGAQDNAPSGENSDGDSNGG